MANYQIPPWLSPVDPVQPYLQGVSLGQRAAAEQNAASARAAQLALQRQQMAQRAAEEFDDYNLRKMQAEAAIMVHQQTAEQKRAEAARRAMAAQAIDADIAAGVPPAEAYARHFARLSTGESLAGLPSLINSLKPVLPPKVVEIDGQRMIVNPNTGSAKPMPVVKPSKITTTPWEANQIKNLDKEVDDASNTLEALRRSFMPEDSPSVVNAKRWMRRAMEARNAFWNKHPELGAPAQSFEDMKPPTSGFASPAAPSPAYVPTNSPPTGTNESSFVTNAPPAVTNAPPAVTNAPPAIVKPKTEDVKKFRDGKGRVWIYTGTASDPKKDRNRENWQLEQ